MTGLISVIVPIHKMDSKFLNVRKQLHATTPPIEIIYVVDKELSFEINNIKSNEQIIKTQNRGRGFMLQEGIHHAKGEIIMFLHADTLLPPGWDKIIRREMQNKNIIGGGFSLTFDVNNLYLKILVKIVTVMYRKTKILSGDRAIFIRLKPLKNNLSILELPIMEDIELSRWMKKQGDVILLKETVITSADAFIHHGYLRQTWRIIKSSLWYKLGGKPQKIYNYYYQK